MQSINDQTDRRTDKRQVKIAIQMSKHLDMPTQCLKPKMCSIEKKEQNGSAS